MTIDEVIEWLEGLSLGQYSTDFQEMAVDGEMLFDLNDELLESELGMGPKLHRMKLLKAIEKLKEKE